MIEDGAPLPGDEEAIDVPVDTVANLLVERGEGRGREPLGLRGGDGPLVGRPGHWRLGRRGLLARQPRHRGWCRHHDCGHRQDQGASKARRHRGILNPVWLYPNGSGIDIPMGDELHTGGRPIGRR